MVLRAFIRTIYHELDIHESGKLFGHRDPPFAARKPSHRGPRRHPRPMTKAQLVEAPRPYPGIKQAKIATASAHAVVTSLAMVQISLVREGAPAETFAQTAKNIG